MEETQQDKLKTVHISESTHSKIKSYLEKDGDGRDIGKFVDKASLEKIENEKKQKYKK